MRSNEARRVLGIVLLSMLSLTLSGCGGSKEFTPEDFKKVVKDMPEDKVKEHLGKPFDSATASGVTWLWWKVGDKYYRAIIKDGKVTETSGPDPELEYKLGKELFEMAPKMGIK